MKYLIALMTLLFLLTPALAQDAHPGSDTMADAEGDVIKQVPRNGTDENGNRLRPVLEPGTGHAPEIDIVQVRAERDGDIITMMMTVAGQPIEMLTGEENITQIAYMIFLEDVDEGAEPSSKTGEIGNWAEVVRCSIQMQGNLTCAAAKGNMAIETVDVGSNNVMVTAKIFDPTMFERLGVGGFTLVFKGDGNSTSFMLDLTTNLDVQNTGGSTNEADAGPSGFVGMIRDFSGWLFGFPQVIFVAGLAAIGVGSFVKKRQEAEAALPSAPTSAAAEPAPVEADAGADEEALTDAAVEREGNAGDDVRNE